MQKTQKIESLNIKVICSAVIISNKNSVIFNVYRPPDQSSLLAFFKELGKYLNQESENYDNFIVMGDFNIDIRQTSPELHKLDEFCSIFSKTIIIKSDTCFTKFHKPNSFQNNKRYRNWFQLPSLATITKSYVLFLNLVTTD